MSFSFRLAWKYLLGRKMRSFLTTLAVVFGVMVIFGMNGMVPAVMESFRHSMMTAANTVDATITSETRGLFEPAVVDSVRATEGVAYATGYLSRNIVLPLENAPAPGSISIKGKSAPVTTLTVTVIGMDPADYTQVVPVSIASGRFLEPGEVGAAVTSQKMAQALSLDLGESFELPSATGTLALTLVGITKDRPVAVDETYMALADAQTLFNTPGKINIVDVLYKSGVDSAVMETALRARLPQNLKLGAIEYGTELLATVDLGQKALMMFGIMALAMGGFIIFNTFRTIVAERRHDIGMLRALGATRADILKIIMAESLLQGVIGTALGLGGGYLLAVLMMRSMDSIKQTFVNLSSVQPAFTPQNYIVAIVLGIGVTLAGGIIPALSAGRLTPLEALRPQVTGVKDSRLTTGTVIGLVLIAGSLLLLLSGQFNLAAAGVLLFLVGLILIARMLVAPIARTFGRLLNLVYAREGLLAQGNMIRQPGRAAITASAMMIGLAIVLAMAGMTTSIFDGFMSYIDKSLGSDFLVIPRSLVLSGGNVGAAPELAQAIAKTDGVAGVATLRMATSEVNGSTLQVIGIDPDTYPEISGLKFSHGDEAQAYPALKQGRAAIVNGIYASTNGVKVGDQLTFKTPGGDQVYTVVGVGMDYLNAKIATAYISQQNLKEDFAEETNLLLMANKTKGADEGAVKAALEGFVKEYPAFALISAAEWRAEQKSLFGAAMVVLYIMVVALAFPSLLALINTLAISVLERTREIGLLRAVGATRRQVRRIIVAESLLLSGMGTAFGILLGIWFGYLLVGALNVSGFVLAYFFPYAGILLTIAVGILFGVLAALIPARQASRMNVVDALHYE